MSVSTQTRSWASEFVPAPGCYLSSRYCLLRLIGRGAMGAVFLAYDQGLERPVAVKFARSSSEMSTTENGLRFRQEIRLIGRLTHPNIVKIFDCGEYQEWLYFVMELHLGPNLAMRLKGGPFDLSAGLVLLDELLAAAEYLHELGLVHRDIKPGNVLLAEGGRAVVADFGLARNAADPRLTLAGMLVGTPLYTAPEVFLGARDHPASDLWSLGVLAYELLSGVVPFSAQTVHGLMMLVLHVDPIPLLRVAVVPALISDWVGRMLKRDPKERFPTARAARQALRGILEVLPGTASTA
jgi:serine/threonine protein kinase